RRERAAAADARSLGFGKNPYAVLLAERFERVPLLARIRGRERRAQRLQLHDLRLVELAREQFGAIVEKQQNGRGKRHADHGDEEHREPSEQRTRPERHVVLSSGAVVSTGSSGTNT